MVRLMGRIDAQHTHPLVCQMFDALNERGLGWTRLSAISGVSVSTIQNWTFRSMPRLDLFEAVLNALGLELIIAPRGTREKLARLNAHSLPRG